MDSEYVMLDDHSATVVQSNTQTDHPPPTSAARATGIRRIPTGTMYPSIVERMDIDLTVCKSDITSLETQAIQQASKLEWMQQELRMAREDRQEMAETINELKNQVMELTTRLENGAVLLKNLSDVCTFRAADFHAMISDIRQQQRDLSAPSSIEPVPPPPPVADTHLPASVQLSAAHEQRETPSALHCQVPIVPQPSTPDQSFDRGFCDTGVQITSSRRVEPAPSPRGPEGVSISTTWFCGNVATVHKSILRQVEWLRKTLLDSTNETTDLEKLKFLQTKTVPRVEKAISELESALQKLASMCDDKDLDLNTATVDSIIQEAGDFITQVTRLYTRTRVTPPD